MGMAVGGTKGSGGRRRRNGRRSAISEINVTPLVDVCLVLLIIFMVVTPMLQPGVDVLLPAGPHAEKKPGDKGDLVISVKNDGTVFVGQNWIPDKDLTTYLQAEYQKDPARNVMLKADKRINYGKVRLVMRAAHEASGTDMVTVAVRRVDITRKSESLLDYIDTSKIFLLPNTAACYTAADAIRTAHLAREAGMSNWVKLEVIGDEQTLFPDNEGLLEATRVLVKDGFVVLPYTNDDPVMCRKLADAGAAAVMPLGAPIGSGLGIQNANNIRIIREQAKVPVIVDAGVGTASDATVAMELGADGVLMNTAIAGAEDPVAMAEAMKLAVQAGRLAYRAGRMGKRMYASASSPPR